MSKLTFSLLALLVVLPLQAKDAGPATFAPRYFDPKTVDFKTLLPNPPAAGSPEEAKDVAGVLAAQANPTPEQLARVQLEAKHLNPWLFENVLGPWFTEKNLPATAKLFVAVDNNEWLVAKAAKEYWNRPRPPLVDKRVKSLVEPPKNASYPSGHSTYGTVDALVLAEIAPDFRAALISRGREIGDDRVIAGVHFPTDVEAGRTLGNAIFQALM